MRISKIQTKLTDELNKPLDLKSLDISLWNDNDYVEVEHCTDCSITLHVNCKIAVFVNIQVPTMAKTDTKVKTRS